MSPGEQQPAAWARAACPLVHSDLLERPPCWPTPGTPHSRAHHSAAGWRPSAYQAGRGSEPTWGWCPPLPRSEQGLLPVGPPLLNLLGRGAQKSGGQLCQGLLTSRDLPHHPSMLSRTLVRGGARARGLASLQLSELYRDGRSGRRSCQTHEGPSGPGSEPCP